MPFNLFAAAVAFATTVADVTLSSFPALINATWCSDGSCFTPSMILSATPLFPTVGVAVISFAS